MLPKLGDFIDRLTTRNSHLTTPSWTTWSAVKPCHHIIRGRRQNRKRIPAICNSCKHSASIYLKCMGTVSAIIVNWYQLHLIYNTAIFPRLIQCKIAFTLFAYWYLWPIPGTALYNISVHYKPAIITTLQTAALYYRICSSSPKVNIKKVRSTDVQTRSANIPQIILYIDLRRSRQT